MRSAKLATLLLLALALGALGCKDKQGVPEEVHSAYVVLVEGVVQATPKAGKQFAIEVGQGLLRSDTIETKSKAFVVLKLRNNYLVRLNESLILRVEEIVLLDADPANQDFKEQLDRLLNPEDQEGAQRSGVYERIAGWRSERQGAESVSTRAPSPEPPRAAVEQEGLAAASEHSLNELQPEAKHMRRTPTSKAPAASGRSIGVISPTPSRSDDQAREKPDSLDEVRSAGTRTDQAGETPAGADLELSLKQALTNCLRDADKLKELPLSGRKLTVRWRVEGGQVTRVWLDGALPTPGCAIAEIRKHLLAQAVDGPGQMEITLP